MVIKHPYLLKSGRLPNLLFMYAQVYWLVPIYIFESCLLLRGSDPRAHHRGFITPKERPNMIDMQRWPIITHLVFFRAVDKAKRSNVENLKDM
jgi:hypothetical protein